MKSLIGIARIKRIMCVKGVQGELREEDPNPAAGLSYYYMSIHLDII